MAVYFEDQGTKAIIITTWNKEYRMANGVGPCSTLQELKDAYGKEVKPAKSGTSPDGKTVHSYTVGKNLIFALGGDLRTMRAVALYDGGAPAAHEFGGTEAFAGYVAAVEAPCT